jgi:hypothetical protein
MVKNFLVGALGGLVAFVLLAASLAVGSPTTLPLPGVNGPSLGDPTTNLYSLTFAYGTQTGLFSSDVTTIDQTSGQANCTQIGNSAITSSLHRLKTSAGTGYICLPTAIAGRVIYFGNATGQTIDIYSSAASYTSGTADTINGTAGSTAYTGLTTGKNAVCFTPVNGVWYCSSIS